MTFQEKNQHENWVRERLYNLGRCNRPAYSKKKDNVESLVETDGRRTCGGKIIMYYVSFEGDNGLYQQFECLKCHKKFGLKPVERKKETKKDERPKFSTL